MKIILNQTFNNRQELDAFVRSRIGEDIKGNQPHELEISPEEGEKLSLGNSSKVYGVKVKIKNN